MFLAVLEEMREDFLPRLLIPNEKGGAEMKAPKKYITVLIVNVNGEKITVNIVRETTTTPHHGELSGHLCPIPPSW